MKKTLSLTTFLLLLLVFAIGSFLGFGDHLTHAASEEPIWQSCESGKGPYCGNYWNYSMGYKFTPTQSFRVTKLCGYFYGTKWVKLYDSSYLVLAKAQVTSSYNWSCSSISPLTLKAGSTYYVVAEIAGAYGCYRWFLNLPKTCNTVTINSSVYQYPSGTFNANHYETTSFMYGMVDIVGSVAAPLPPTPTCEPGDFCVAEGSTQVLSGGTYNLNNVHIYGTLILQGNVTFNVQNEFNIYSNGKIDAKGKDGKNGADGKGYYYWRYCSPPYIGNPGQDGESGEDGRNIEINAKVVKIEGEINMTGGSGGKGGKGADVDSGNGGYGGRGGDGGKGGLLKINAEKIILTGSIFTQGGGGGLGGNGGSTSGTHGPCWNGGSGGRGGNGGLGGKVIFNASISTDISGKIQTMGGIGGGGGSGGSGQNGGSGNNGGNGGDGGEFYLNSPLVSISGQIETRGATGSYGGGGGRATFGSGKSGNGGNGGKAGNVELKVDDLTLSGKIIAKGGGGGTGGTGRSGGYHGSDGGDGGVGGKGGNINFEGDSLNFSGTIYASGGGGGTGGVGRYLGGDGGAGGSGGDSGQISLLIKNLSINSGYIYLLGGSGGSGNEGGSGSCPYLGGSGGEGGNGGNSKGIVFEISKANKFKVYLYANGGGSGAGGECGSGGDCSGNAGKGGKGGRGGEIQISGDISLLEGVIEINGGKGGKGGDCEYWEYCGNGGDGGESGKISINFLGSSNINSEIKANGGKGGDLRCFSSYSAQKGGDGGNSESLIIYSPELEIKNSNFSFLAGQGGCYSNRGCGQDGLPSLILLSAPILTLDTTNIYASPGTIILQSNQVEKINTYLDARFVKELSSPPGSPAPIPTLLSLHGKVVDKTGKLIEKGSLRIEIKDLAGGNIWGPYNFDGAISNGAINLTLGASYELKLIPNQKYKMHINISNQSTYSCPTCEEFVMEFSG